MKTRFLLFLMLFAGFLYTQGAEPYRHLMITECYTQNPSKNYVEITNVGDSTINLRDFKYGTLGWNSHKPILDVWKDIWSPMAANLKAKPPITYVFMLPDKVLAPGQSFVITAAYDFGPEQYKLDPYGQAASERPKKTDIYDVTDLLLHASEFLGYSTGNLTDSVSLPFLADGTRSYSSNIMNMWDGRNTIYLEHKYTEKDSAVIDQFGGVFDNKGRNNNRAYDVAGVVRATANHIFVRKNKYKTGNLDFANARGLSAEDSEWIVLNQSTNADVWRDTWWITGNHGNNVLDANTLESDVAEVDFAGKKITVPYGTGRQDDVMHLMKRKPGLAWFYHLNENSEDSIYRSAKTGDKLIIIVCGDEMMKDTFEIVVSPPTPGDNMLIPISHTNEHLKPGGTGPIVNTQQLGKLEWPRVTKHANGLDTITGVRFGIPYGLRTDSLLKYLEKPANAKWEFVWVDGAEKRVDLKNGDKLKVTSQNGSVKEYFIEMQTYAASNDASLIAITWPDIPSFYKGIFGWKGDTIPGFSQTVYSYKVEVPLDVTGIPALVAKPFSLNTKVLGKRASSLAGSIEDRTATFVVTAEDGVTTNTYKIEFIKEKDPAYVQPFFADPFLSEYIYNDILWDNFAEVANAGNQPLDLSNYMFTMNAGIDPNTHIGEAATDADWNRRYMKYVPGKKWSTEAEWPTKVGILETDFAINPIVRPGDVFAMGWIGQSAYQRFPYMSDPAYSSWTWGGFNVDINFTTDAGDQGLVKYNLQNPWITDSIGENPDVDYTVLQTPNDRNFMIFKILNDSVKNGLKAANDPDDFELIDNVGNADGSSWWTIEQNSLGIRESWRRKPEIFKGNPTPGASFGTTWNDSEWVFWDAAYWAKLGHPIGISWFHSEAAVAEDLGRHNMIAPTHYMSTIASKFYKVSPGYSMAETILGLTTGTTVTGFYNNIIKANELQTLEVKSNGVKLADEAAISNGDILTVLSADSKNTSAYTLSVTELGLSSNAVLTSVPYTIDIAGTTGTIGGFNRGTKLKDVLAGVVVPAGATLTITDEKDAYMSLLKVNYDTAYVNVTATDHVYFEVIAENGITKILYQLKPTVIAGDVYATSDVYSIDQFACLVQFVPTGTTPAILLNNVTPSPGASIKIYDKIGTERTTGIIYRDDKLIVTSEDGKSTKAYYFSMLNFNVNTYMAFVVSDDYLIDQVAFTIKGTWSSTTQDEFMGKLYTSFGATLKVLDKDGNISTSANLNLGDQLLVTAADGYTTALYSILNTTNVDEPFAQAIKMYPNPTIDGRVIVQGLAKGNKVRVFNAAGILIRDVIADNSTDYVSLASQPSGIYVFVISAGNQPINIQKIVKR